ncbi:hypothetical protein KTR66_04550 [Roseococcus sp. SDR]|uniref:hypothetical protein n=1 Tax=Roseococcus sp. SDR TaxID=2835532 RepID=UPI001BCDDB01|nr:hypothetical protein [Roseococcus sp. SDR]MBS7789249.1 hypothetical protein [Roseococcus sp. SDR]MBV1844563.1 hypothetical protein [Roseococcus sp. SDR]
MTQNPIPTLPPAELRGYARGLRHAATDLGDAWELLQLADGDGQSLTVDLKRIAWRREADLVEGFAARLEAVETALAEAQRDLHEEFRISPEDMAEPESMLPAWRRPEPSAELGRRFMLASGEWGTLFGAVTRKQELGTTKEEQAQTSLADAVADDLAQHRPTEEETATAEAAEAEPPPVDPSRQRAQRSDSPWTDERLALLRRLFPTIMHQDRMLAVLNALPGLPIPSANAIGVKARKLNLHRRGEPVPPEYANAPTSRTMKPQNAEAPASKPIVTAEPMDLSPQDWAELREKFRTKEFGTKHLTEDWNLSEARAQEVITQLRAEAATRRAA